MKYIVVAGGVVSGLGKGVTISSMGRMLQGCGVRVTSVKIDPYLNVDAGTMSPFEHGECFVLNDGGETDLDLGNYERFLSISLTSDHNITTGKVYRKVIGRERRGDYLGKTVQVVPHITDEIQAWIERVALVPVDDQGNKHWDCVDKEGEEDGGEDGKAGKSGDGDEDIRVADICLIEVGGTVGDIESSVFFEALRQFQFRVAPEDFCLTFVSLVPIMGEEQKTKPTQHGVRDLRSLGLSPAVIFCRCREELAEATKQKISNFCHVRSPDNVLSVHDVGNVYHVPLLLVEQNLHRIIAKELNLEEMPGLKDRLDLTLGGLEDVAARWDLKAGVSAGFNEAILDEVVEGSGKLDAFGGMSRSMIDWARMSFGVDGYEEVVKIVLVGKYTGLQDSYLSVIKSLKHASIAVERKLELIWVEAAHLEDEFGDGSAGGEKEHKEAWDNIKGADGVVVPGGFGTRGFLGKVLTAEYCRKNSIPFLGICLGFQAMVVEYSRNIIGWENANSTEFDESTEHPVVLFMPEIDKDQMGGTMRLGARPTTFTHPTHDDGSPSIAKVLYGGVDAVSERHRHRYEVNPDRVEAIHEAGLKFVGRDDTGKRMEIAELPRSVHPYYVGAQYHPEFKSRPLNPSPVFHGLLLAACGRLDGFMAKKAEKAV